MLSLTAFTKAPISAVVSVTSIRRLASLAALAMLGLGWFVGGAPAAASSAPWVLGPGELRYTQLDMSKTELRDATARSLSCVGGTGCSCVSTRLPARNSYAYWGFSATLASVDSITVLGRGWRTRRGVRYGTKARRLPGIYPGIRQRESTYGNRTWWWDQDPAGRLLFLSSKGEVFAAATTVETDAVPAEDGFPCLD